LLIVHGIFEGVVMKEGVPCPDITGFCPWFSLDFTLGSVDFVRIHGNWVLSALNRGSYFPTRIPERALITPKTFRSHKTTTITTTAFKIDLMEPAMGMNRLMSQRITPTTIRTTMT
jgi:hypothetical protein